MTPIQRAIGRALDNEHLSKSEMVEVMGQIMDGNATAAQIAGFLVALRAKGEHVDELVGAATEMRARAVKLALPDAVRVSDQPSHSLDGSAADQPPHSLGGSAARPGGAGSIDQPPHSLGGSAARPGGAGSIDQPPHSLGGSAARPGGAGSIDTCGTGGDASGTVNISTLAAMLLAACGATVAKHGNRALSSKCGSADVLEALGVAVDAAPEVVERSMRAARIGFAFAPRFHAATKHVAVPRRELATRTIFNLLGPLTNPAHVQHQVVGVFAKKWCEPMAAALGALGLRRAAVVHGAGGIDEVAVSGETFAAIWDGGKVQSMTLTPRDFGCDEVDPSGLAGGDASHNAAIIRKVLANHHVDHGERYEAVLHAAAMTAALGLELLEPTGFEASRLPKHYQTAVAAVASGAARLALHKWREASWASPDQDLTYLNALRPEDYAGVE